MKNTILSLLLIAYFIGDICAQPWFKRVDSVTVKLDTSGNIIYPWAGGLNYCQFSEIDLNLDGIKDLFVFDRTGNKITTFLNNGTSGMVDYVFAPQYRGKFPQLSEWALLADYNCDGRADIFTYSKIGGGIDIYRNDSDPINGLVFTLTYLQVKSDYHPNVVNLYVSSVDIPAISDIDNDGDLDVVTFSIFGTFMEFHKNMSKELKGNCDTMAFQLASSCWGNFTENSFDNKVNLNQSCKVSNYSPDQVDPSQVMHTGACELCFDADGDGDKEILLGGVGYNNLTLATNGGTPNSANMVSQNPAYPPSTPVNLAVFPCAFYLDADNDGLKDLIISPNAANASENFTSVLMYKNTGSSNAVDFTFQKNNFLQDQMIDVGEGAYPIFFDYDGDGLQDLLVANADYYSTLTLKSSITLFKNTGTLTKPSFQLITRDYANIQSYNLRSIVPAFGDIDGDNDLDMILGNNQGNLQYFANSPLGAVANFPTLTPNYKDNMGAVIDVGNFAAPQLIDVDRDGKLDLIIGNSAGKIFYYRNTGTKNAPIFTLVTSNFGGVNVVRKSTYSITGYSIPYMFNYGGNYKLLVGSESGYVYCYSNIDGNLGGSFTLVDSSYQQIWEGQQISVAGTDINNDGMTDIAIGNYAGGVSLYYGQTANWIAEHRQHNVSFNVYPNPATNELWIELASHTGSAKAELIDLLGRVVGQSAPFEILSNINTTNIQSGIYICMVSDGNGRFATKKILIQH